VSRRGGGSSTDYYVVVEVTGYSVASGIYNKIDDIKTRAAVVEKVNRDIQKANKAADAELKKLRDQLASKSRELAKCDDTARKTHLETDITSLKAQIEQKDGERRAPTRMLEPRKFSTREDADKYVETVLKQAQKAAEKRDEKKKGDA